MKKYPFKFLDAYTQEDHDIFFGRDREVDELYRMVFQTNLLLVYGASGTGKTSLIRCGLANRFKPTQWLDLYIRRGADINQSLLDTIRKSIPGSVAVEANGEEPDWFERLVAEETGKTERPASFSESDQPVIRALQELYLASFTPVYLIFDQFEELYTLGHAREQEQFTDLVAELVRLPMPLKVIIVIREEYLARLYKLERAVPQLRDKKLRIEAMDFPRVEEVILQATTFNANSNVNLQPAKEREIAQAIVESIREGDVNIQLPYLQVFMDRLYELASGQAIAREQAVTISLDLVQQAGSIGDVLTDFIDRQNQRIQAGLAARYGPIPQDTVWQLLSPFATIDGTKVPIRQDDLVRLQAIVSKNTTAPPVAFIKDVIAELENSRILRYRKEEQTYEVAHDTLARQIAEKRSEEEKAYLKARRIVTEGMATYADTQTLLSAEQLAYIRPYQQRLEADLTGSQFAYIRRSQRKRRRQRRWIRIRIAAGFALAFLVILVVLREQQRTQHALDEVLSAQAARERTELSVLLQNAAQIAKGSNCPPPEMRQVIDSLYQRHQEAVSLQQQYRETMDLLVHCGGVRNEK